MGEPARKFRGHEYMPIKLKGVIIEHGISRTRLAQSVLQSNGQPMSATAMTQLINWGYYPKSTKPNVIQQQVEAALRAHAVPEAEIATIWEFAGDDSYRNANPVGFALGTHPPHRKKGTPQSQEHEPDIEPMEVQMLSPAAKKHFRLFRDPFKDDVASPDDVFLSADQRYISEAMYQTAKHGGFLAVVGESGSGKSTLRKMLLERIRDQSIRVVFPRVLDKTRLSTGAICQAIINDLAPGQTIRSSLEAQARQVEQVLLASSRADNSHVLLIEEAHDLSITTLKYLKRFYELEDGFRKLLSIVLVGQPELKDKLDENRHPEAREVIRRIEIAELVPLGNHLQEYLSHKFKRAGTEVAQVFAEDAFDAIRARLTKARPGGREVVSQMYPLIVNNLATKAMNRAADLGVPSITADLVREV